MKVFQQGCGPIALSKNDFLASGGEGAVYVKGDTAFKIYTDATKMIPAGKIAELGAIADSRVIKPEALLLDKAGGSVIGYAMPFVRDAVTLCQLLPRSYRERMGIGPEDTLRLVGELAERLRSVHRAGALVVDVSEMNFLASRQLDTVYAIDADSYQTPHYPATAITLSVRDPASAAAGFSELSDWFSFAVLSFQLLVGVHPYKGKHPDVKGLSERMAQHISVFDREVRIPKVAYPLDVIPSGLRPWYEAVLQRGERLPPPTDPGRVRVVTLVDVGAAQTSAVELTLLYELGGAVRAIYSDSRSLWVVAEDGLYQDGRPIDRAPPVGSVLGWTPRGRVVVAHRRPDGLLELRDPTGGVLLQAPSHADALMSTGGRIYAKSGDKIVELLLRDVGSTVVASARVAASVLPHATKIFDGLAVQSLLGASYLSLFPTSGRHLQLRVPELDGAEVVDGRCDFPVAVLVIARAGSYQRLILRIAADGSRYDLREEPASQPEALGMVSLDSGVCVRFREDDSLELAASAVGAPSARIVSDDALSAGWQLAQHAGKVLCATGSRVYRMRTKADGERERSKAPKSSRASQGAR